MGEEKVKAGDTVKFFCETMLDDGKPVQKSDKPISKRIGAGELIRSLDSAIMGMTLGEEKTFSVKPEEAYGNIDNNFIRTIPIEYFKNNKIEPQVGIRIRTINGDCTIKSISGKEVEVDYNHPLAGRNLVFRIKVEEIIKGE
jgi:FKBP-type peptidyl-prolyl cis-trans isomerase SlyD